MEYQVTDEMLRALTQEWVAALPVRYPESERPRHFSLRFHWKMRTVFRRAKEEARGETHSSALLRGGRFAVALLAAALLTATVAMAFPAIRERVFRAVWERHEEEDYTRLYYEEVVGEGEEAPQPEPSEDREFTLYRFSYLPEGFTLEKYFVLGSFHHEVFYDNEERLFVSLDQSWLDQASPVDMTWLVEPEEITLKGGRPAWYVDGESLKSVHWDDGEYAFGVTTLLSREETIRIAESLVPVEEPFADVKFASRRADWLPEGFSKAEAQSKKDSYQLRYEDRSGGSLTLEQSWWEWGAFGGDIGEMEDQFLLEGQQVWLEEGPEGRALYWDYGEYSFRLSSDTLSREELTKVAVNLHPAGKKAEALSPYRLTYVPEGFARTGNGYSGRTHYEYYNETAENGEQEDPREIAFYQEPLGEDGLAVDPEGWGAAEVTLSGGRTAWVVDDPPKELTMWHKYAFAVWWEEDGYLMSLYSPCSREETVKIAEGVLKL